MNVKKYKQVLKIAMDYIKNGETVETTLNYFHSEGVKATRKQVEQFKTQVESNSFVL